VFWKKKSSSNVKPVVQESADGSENYFIKLVLMGDGAVGKTSIRRNYLGLSFTSEHMMTIGADFAAKDKSFEFETQDGSQNRKFNVTFQIWDLAGQSTFQNVRSMYYKGCFGGLLVFDRTRPSSLENIENWVSEMQKSNSRGNIPLILLGNKADLIDTAEEIVPQEDVDNLLKKLNEEYSDESFEITYFDTSALTGKNIEEAFEVLTSNILHWLKVL
jgi:small GTP-binding protein